MPAEARGYADSGYHGYDKEHPHLDMPCRKPKGGKLAREEKAYNRGPSSIRLSVDHRLVRTKRFRIRAERVRNPLRTHRAKTLIVAGFWPE